MFWKTNPYKSPGPLLRSSGLLHGGWPSIISLKWWWVGRGSSTIMFLDNQQKKKSKENQLLTFTWRWQHHLQTPHLHLSCWTQILQQHVSAWIWCRRQCSPQLLGDSLDHLTFVLFLNMEGRIWNQIQMFLPMCDKTKDDPLESCQYTILLIPLPPTYEESSWVLKKQSSTTWSPAVPTPSPFALHPNILTQRMTLSGLSALYLPPKLMAW